MAKITCTFLAIYLLCFKVNAFQSQNGNSPLRVKIPKGQNMTTEEHESKNLNETTHRTSSPRTMITTETTTPLTTASSTTTTVPTVFTASTTDSSVKNESQSGSKVKLDAITRALPPKYFCKCDLFPNFCDSSCCCDIDCSNKALRVFDCKDHELDFQDYEHDQGLPSCDINESWLCVFKDNTKNKLQKMYKSKLKFKTYSWPNPVITLKSEEKQEFYKVGDPIMLYNEITEEMESLDIPFSFTSSACLVYEPLRYLQGFNRECSMTFEKAQNFYKAFYDKLTKYSILKLPKNVESNEIMTAKSHGDDGDCIEPELYYCTESVSACKKLANTTLENEHYYTSIKIKVQHNYTYIIRFEVFFTENLLTEEYSWHNFEVNFIHINETEAPKYNISGPLGYNLRSPIIVTKLILTNESTESLAERWAINYFYKTSSQHQEENHIRIPESAGGDCITASSNVINFGENYFMQCNVRINHTIIDSTTNFTVICNKLQEDISKFLFGNQNISSGMDMYVSKLGFPRNKTEYWLKIEMANFETINVLAIHHHERNSFSCQNVIIGLQYIFYTVSMEVSGIPNQNVIKLATKEVDPRVDLIFKLGEEIVVPISFQVKFYDQTDFN